MKIKTYWRRFMSSYYPKIPERLQLYRKALNLTQEQMGKRFGVNQSHYYKLESGHKIISLRSLQCFEEQGGDVCYLLTGRRHITGQMNCYMDRCITDHGKNEFSKAMLWIIKQGIYLSKSQKLEITDFTLKNMELSGRQLKSPSIWKNIRDIEGLSQHKMAEELDIGFKRFERIERKQGEADAEILCTLYERFHYSPLAVLNHQEFCLDEMNQVWEEFTDEIQHKLEPYLENALRLINEYEKELME